MTTHQAIVALLASLGYELRDVSEVTVDPHHVWVTHVGRDAADTVLSSHGEPIEHTTKHRWQPDSGDGS